MSLSSQIAVIGRSVGVFTAYKRQMAIAADDPLTVLLLEDNQDDERLALRALRSCGLPLVVRVARDGQAGLEALGLDGPPEGDALTVPDLVISDLKMPRLNGDEVLARTRGDARLQSVPYVMFSSSGEVQDLNRCTELGAAGYYVKPVAFDEYMDCLRGIVRRWLLPEDDVPEPDCALEPPTSGVGVN